MPTVSWQRLAGLCGALATMAAACHHQAATPVPSEGAMAVDSIVGKVQVVGVQASPRIMLVRDGGARSLTLVGRPSLANVDGLRVGVVGKLDGSKLSVIRFTVLEANGVPATDGRLVAEGDDLYLETADRVRHRLVQPSPKLRAQVGRRVWVSGPLDQEPVAYGFIE
jgi:hypothetical protein